MSGRKNLNKDSIIVADVAPRAKAKGILRSALPTKRVIVTKRDPDTDGIADAIEASPLPHAQVQVKYDATADVGGSSGTTSLRSTPTPGERFDLPALVIHADRAQERGEYPLHALGTQQDVRDLSTPVVQIEQGDPAALKIRKNAPLSTGFRVDEGRLCILGDDAFEGDDIRATTLHGALGGSGSRARGMGVMWSREIGGSAIDQTRVGQAWAPMFRGEGTPSSAFGLAAPTGGGTTARGPAGGGGGAGGAGGSGGGAGDDFPLTHAALAAVDKANAEVSAAYADLQHAINAYTQLGSDANTRLLKDARARYEAALLALVQAENDAYVAQAVEQFGFTVGDIANFSQVEKAIQDAGRAVIAAFDAVIAADARLRVVLASVNRLVAAEFHAAYQAAVAEQQRAKQALLQALAALRALGAQIVSNGGTWSVGSTATFGGQFATNPDGSVTVGGAHGGPR